MTGSRLTRRARDVVPAVLAGALVLALGACAGDGFDPLAAPSATSTARSETPTSSPSGAASSEPEDAQSALSRLFAAGVAGDRAGWDSRVATVDPAFTARSNLLFANLAALRPSRFRVRLTGAEQELPAARRKALGRGATVVQATLAWRLGRETSDATSSVWLTLVPAPGGLVLAGTGDGTDLDRPALPLWWLGAVSRATDGRAIVVVGEGQDAKHWARLADHAADQALDHLPKTQRRRWDGRLVVLVPGSQADFAAVLGSAPGSYAGTAAVTRPFGPTTRAAVRVVVNPATAGDGDAELGTTLTHEAVHVATRSARSAAPLWAVEGLAEYVALEAHPGQRDAEVAALRSAGLPARLPSDDDFTAGAKDVTASYAQAWLVCKAVAEHRGRDDLGHFYDALDDGDSVEEAARSTLGVDDSVVVGWWQSAMAAAVAGRV